MKNKDSFEFGKEALENSKDASANPRNIPEAKDEWDIYNLCEKALEEDKEVFVFTYKGKDYSALLEKSFVLSKITGYDSDGEPDIGDFAGRVILGDFDFSDIDGEFFG